MFAASAHHTNKGISTIIAARRAEERARERQELEVKRSNEIIAKYREVTIETPSMRSVFKRGVKGIILTAIAGTKFTYDDVVGSSRAYDLIYIRHYAMLCAWSFRTDKTLSYLGRQFGGRDHTSILHAVRKFGFAGRDEAARFIQEHGRDETIARIPHRQAKAWAA